MHTENGVPFDEVNKKCESMLKEVLGRKKTDDNGSDHNAMVEVELNQQLRATGKQYQRKLFSLNIAKYPRAQVLCFSLASSGGDLCQFIFYVCGCELVCAVFVLICVA